MNMKSGLLGLGLLVTAGALTVSCGGDSDGDNGNTAGKGTGVSGSTGTAGTTSSTAGTTGSSTAGTTGSSTAGTTSTGGNGSSTGGSGNNTGGTNNNNGGTNNNSGGADPGNNENCPATAPTDGAACEESTGFEGCDYGETNCRCQRTGGGGPGGGDGGAAAVEREWNCQEQMDPGGFGGFGNEGGNGNIGDVECPDTEPEDDDACTGTGFCQYPGGGCACFNGMFNCF